MVKIFNQDHTFEHPFDTVSSAFWRKYPNDQNPHVKEIDAYARKIDHNGRLIVHRIMRCESAIPSWMTSLGVSSSAFAAETTVVDPATKQMIVKSRNITGASMMIVEETCTYTPHADNSNWTSYNQKARIAAFLPFLSKKLESFTHNNMSIKAPQGLDVIERLCQRIRQAGVLSLFDGIDVKLASTAETQSPSTMSD